MAIVGVGHAGMGEAHGRTEMEILAEAAHNAVRDAGLNLRDIDGICNTLPGSHRLYPGLSLACTQLLGGGTLSVRRPAWRHA